MLNQNVFPFEDLLNYLFNHEGLKEYEDNACSQ